MKVLAFAVREDEKEFFKKYGQEYNIKIDYISENLTENNVDLCKGYNGVIFLGNCTVNKIVLEKLNSFGIKYISNRSAGFNNIDLKVAKQLGIKVSNANYSPYSVGEYAVMLGMMLLRKLPQTIKNVEKNNYSLYGLMGREVRNQTIGIIGTGKIGTIVGNIYKAMGAEVLAYDLYPNSKNFKYVSLEMLLKTSDIISLHSPLTEKNIHLLNEKNMKFLKKNVIIINTARGPLIDTGALIKKLEQNEIGGVGLDTLEGELNIFHRDCSKKGYENIYLDKLKTFDNVIITPHSAFYTDQAIEDMVQAGIKNMVDLLLKGYSDNLL
ncbi:NAD(P)-dependent oxidoreductase [Cetobacterium ceti]